MEPSDRQLLIATHKGSGPAAEALWARFSPRLLAYAGAILHDRDAAADIVQTVFVQLLAQPRAAIWGVADVPAWLVRLTRNAAISHLRARGRREARAGGPPEASAPPISFDAQLVRDALDAIPRRDREIIVLKHIAGLTFDQIALALCMNRNTAASRYRAGIERLRSKLKPEPAAVGASR